MSAGNVSVMNLVGGTSTAIVGSSNTPWAANLAAAPFSVTIASVVNSTATTPGYSIWVTNDVPISAVSATSSSATTFSTNSQATWFSSFATNQSSNTLVTITSPFRYLTIVATAGSTNQTVTATIAQAG